MVFQPAIKWSGSKRSQCNEIIKHFPKKIKTYYEPFCGGASMLRCLLDSDIEAEHYICSDLNSDLINLWNKIKSDADYLSTVYELYWTEMNDLSTESEKREYYEYRRSEFNRDRFSGDFIFLNRTCFNGLIRYNSKGEFNSPFHLKRKGIEPNKFRKIINEWSDLLNKYNVKFINQSYDAITVEEGDFAYLDPPYANTKGMYFDNFDKDKFFEFLRTLKCSYLLSYDGKSGDKDNTFEIPNDLYDKHYYMKSGNSSFKRLAEIDSDAVVYESLYLKNI